MTPRPLLTRLVLGVTTVALAGAGACSGGPTLADRTQPSVRAEERRIEGLLAVGSPDPVAFLAPSRCRVRLLRQEGATSWAWTICEVTGSTVGEAFAGPLRVDGDRLWMPDAPNYLEKITSRFPADLVDDANQGNNEFFTELGLPIGSPLPTPLPTG